MDIREILEKFPTSDKAKLFYYINTLTNVHRLFILPFVASDILAVAHGEGHPGFSQWYRIITHFWYICGLTKLFCAFIWHCFQCLALQTRQYLLYRSLQPIKSPLILFFTLTLNFMLVLPLLKKKYNTIMSVICKFSKQVTLIDSSDTWSAEQ